VGVVAGLEGAVGLDKGRRCVCLDANWSVLWNLCFGTRGSLGCLLGL
jgi:hypothetical protein